VVEQATGLTGLTPQQRSALVAAEVARRRADNDRVTPRPPGTDSVRASPAQRRLWFLDQLAPGTPIYNVPFKLRIRGALDPSTLRTAFERIVARHEVLRTVLVDSADELKQIVQPADGFELPIRDLSRLPASAREREAERLARIEAAGSFDLARDRMLRVLLLKLDDADHLLLITVHHVALDGWSVTLLRKELAAEYSSALTGAAALPALPAQYADFSLWQQKQGERGAVDLQLAYWRKQLADLPTLELPTDRRRPDHPPYVGERVEHLLPDGLVSSLDDLGQAEGATVFMTTFAAFQVLLHHYTNQSDLAVGAAFAGRAHREVESMIGMFANMLVLRTRIDGDLTFRELLRQVRETVLAAEENQHVPFERLVDELRVQRDPTRNPLFQVAFSLQSATTDEFSLEGLEVTELPIDSGTSRFDLAFNLERRTTGDHLWADYSTELWDRERIVRMFGHFRTLLQAVAAEPDARVSDLPLLTEREVKELVVDFNDTATEYPSEATLDELIDRHVQAHPEAPAVEMGDVLLTYGDLDRAAETVAARLDAVGPGDIVGVCMNRSPELVVALLAVLRRGAAYVPLDTADPPARLATILADTGSRFVLADETLAGSLPAGVTRIEPGIKGMPEDPPSVTPRRHGPRDAAYVIFTSGSTGAPKGVVVEHAAAVNFVTQVGRLFALGPQDRMLQFANPTFDVSVFEIFATLSSGGTVCLADRNTLLDPDRLSGFIVDQGITVMDMAPAMMALLPSERFTTLRIVFVGGEAFPASLVEAWNLPSRRFFNGYGPTEATVTCIVHECRGSYSASPPIGRPLGNYRAYVLGPYGNPLPAGIPGELHLAGIGLARGYLNRPELTAERFIPDPLQPAGAVMYRTGDLVHQQWNGELVFLGRVDRQVKMRGLRIELGEIEAALVDHPAVRQASVVLSGAAADARLVAYFVAASPCESSALRAHLADRLPSHMVPSKIIRIDAIPLTTSGKVDHARLPSPDKSDDADRRHVQPRTATEQTLLSHVVQRVLDVGQVSVTDNFFDLGGNSLHMTRLVGRIRRVFGVDVDLGSVYRAATIAELAELVDEAITELGQADSGRRRSIEAQVAELSDDEVLALLEAEAEETL
jgi:amino acid adenylation domain-containing protein